MKTNVHILQVAPSVLADEMWVKLKTQSTNPTVSGHFARQLGRNQQFDAVEEEKT